MVKIGKLTISQPINLQTTQHENQESVSNQTQTTEPSNTPKSSANTWQRAGLEQDGLMQQSIQYRHLREKIEQDKEAREEKGNGSLFGSIFGGLLVGTSVGGDIAGKSDLEKKKNDLRDMIEKESEEIKKLQAELDEVYDSNFVATANWLSGRDEGTEIQGDSNVNQATARKRAADPFKDDDD